MNRTLRGLLAGAVTLLGGAALAQQAPAPTTNGSASAAADDANAMNMTPEEMRRMNAQTEPATRATHAPEASLERAAASEDVVPPMMPGMETDMNDAGLHHEVWVENLEGVYGTQNGGAWDAQAWLGGDFDKLWIKSEGATLGDRTEGAKVEALWARALLPYWDTQLGIRDDFGAGPSRQWAAFGAQGISPYWFDVELTGYVGGEGRTALRLKSEYDLYLTQRLVIKPEIELNAYGKPDRARDIGAGLSDGEFELRLRYEFTRRFAPYVGYVYDRYFAGSAILARQARDSAIDHRGVAGIAFFF